MARTSGPYYATLLLGHLGLRAGTAPLLPRIELSFRLDLTSLVLLPTPLPGCLSGFTTLRMEFAS